MKWNLLRLLRSFRSKILFSFLAFACILLAWIGIYQWINYKEKQLKDFNADLSGVQSRFLESTRFLQHFIVQGYHDPNFYITGKQRDIDQYLSLQADCLYKLKQLRTRATGKNMGLEQELGQLVKLSARLADSARTLKEVYFQKGFKDYGWEGRMRKYAHLLEDSAMVAEKDILMLRRHEKDYLIRGETIYADAFYERISEMLTRYPAGSAAHLTLEKYRTGFASFEKYTSKLGIYHNYGLYSHVQTLINSTGNLFIATQAHATRYVTSLQDTFKQILVIFSVVMLFQAIFLSLGLSKLLTRDITELNRRMLSFVQSRFKEIREDQPDESFKPSIAEVEQLNRHFLLLKKNLKSTLEDLEASALQAQKESGYKSTFLANMSHEIRTPLNGIIGMLHILKSSSPTPEQEDYLQTMEFSAGHLMDIINMTLDYSKIEAGKIELEKIPFDLKGDLVKLIKLFEYKTREKGLALELHYEWTDPYMLAGDPLRLQQVLINLVNNAIKFTEKGKICLGVSGTRIDAHHARIRFKVKDPGIGIRSDHLNDLFDAFRQGDSSITRNYGGTGLGLTIANELVNLMGGTLQAESELNKGSVFYFEIDLAISDRLTEQVPVATKKAATSPNLRILLAEDNIINQKVIGMLLQKMGHLVDIAENGVEACALYAQNVYDIILMDIQMPVMDGMMATSHIKKLEKYVAGPIPVIAVTANAFVEDREKAFEAGMDDFLSKPLKPAELESILAKFHLNMVD